MFTLMTRVFKKIRFVRIKRQYISTKISFQKHQRIIADRFSRTLFLKEESVSKYVQPVARRRRRREQETMFAPASDD